MKEIKKGIAVRKITTPELFILAQLACNDYWHLESLKDNFTPTRSMVAIFTDSPIKSSDDLMCLHAILQVEDLILGNLENKELIKLSGKTIYENSDSIVKYAKLSIGLFTKCKESANYNDIYDRFFKNRSIVVFKFDKSIPLFEGTIDALVWANLNLKRVSYFSEEHNGEYKYGCAEEIDKILSTVKSSAQLVYMTNRNKKHCMAILSTDIMKGDK